MKNSPKILTTLLAILYIAIFSLFNYDEYKDFHQEKIEIVEQELDLQSKLENFKLEDIKEIDDIDFYYTPDKELLQKIVLLIENAKKEIYLETYMLTEKKIQEALIKAHKNWIWIKVILEKDPYLAYNINNKAYSKLEKAWINIVWSNKSNYSFNHSKVLIIDDLSIISTGNYSYSTFTKNRDFFIFTTDENIKEDLIENFNNDFNWLKINIFDENLIFSPNSSRVKFEKLFNSAKNDIK